MILYTQQNHITQLKNLFLNVCKNLNLHCFFYEIDKKSGERGGGGRAGAVAGWAGVGAGAALEVCVDSNVSWTADHAFGPNGRGGRRGCTYSAGGPG